MWYDMNEGKLDTEGIKAMANIGDLTKGTVIRHSDGSVATVIWTDQVTGMVRVKYTTGIEKTLTYWNLKNYKLV